MLSQTQQLIRHYNLQPHQQGGYFKQIYRSQATQPDTKKNLMTVIYYLISKQSPLAVWHVNKSDIMHLHLRGGSLVYDVISPEGKNERIVLGQDFKNGETHSLVVKGGYYKATTLISGDFGLLGEAMAPGFQYGDNQMFSDQVMAREYPALKEVIMRKELHEKLKNNTKSSS